MACGMWLGLDLGLMWKKHARYPHPYPYPELNWLFRHMLLGLRPQWTNTRASYLPFRSSAPLEGMLEEGDALAPRPSLLFAFLASLAAGCCSLRSMGYVVPCVGLGVWGCLFEGVCALTASFYAASLVLGAAGRLLFPIQPPPETSVTTLPGGCAGETLHREP